MCNHINVIPMTNAQILVLEWVRGLAGIRWQSHCFLNVGPKGVTWMFDLHPEKYLLGWESESDSHKAS